VPMPHAAGENRSRSARAWWCHHPEHRGKPLNLLAAAGGSVFGSLDDGRASISPTLPVIAPSGSSRPFPGR